MKPLRIAFVPLIRTTFDVPLAQEMIIQSRAQLLAAGFDLVEPDQAVSDMNNAQKTAKDLANEPLDLIIIFQATFADSTMVVELTEHNTAPIFLWAVPEPWTGGRLRLNSLCGINLAGHALSLRNRKYDYAYGLPNDPQVILKIHAMATVGQLIRKLKTARLGVIGEHPVGMDSCHLDQPALLAKFGIQIDQIDLDEVFTRARKISHASLNKTRADLDIKLDNLADLEQAPLNGTLSVYNALKEISDERKLDGLAVRCWPEFFTEMGCAACGAMSMLSDGFGKCQPIPTSCEADINGTLTQLILQWLSGTPAFGTDMVGVDVEKDRIALWHCGLAPLSMADPNIQAHGTVHSNRKLPLVLDFPLKPGIVTVARISQSGGSLRLVLGKGEILAEEKPFSGTAGILKLDCHARQFIDLLMQKGLEHHISLTYGNFLEELLAFANLINLPVLLMQNEEVN